MKLLFDQNLSHRLCKLLADLYPGTEQVNRIGLEQASDNEIWEFARAKGFVIVTLDSDFAEIAALRGVPPKIIWLRCGNQPTAVVERLLRDYAEMIAQFDENADVACLELY